MPNFDFFSQRSTAYFISHKSVQNVPLRKTQKWTGYHFFRLSTTYGRKAYPYTTQQKYNQANTSSNPSSESLCYPLFLKGKSQLWFTDINNKYFMIFTNSELGIKTLSPHQCCSLTACHLCFALASRRCIPLAREITLKQYSLYH